MGLGWIGLGFVIVWFVLGVDFWLDVCVWCLVLFGCFDCGDVVNCLCGDVLFCGCLVWSLGGCVFVGLFGSCGLGFVFVICWWFVDGGCVIFVFAWVCCFRWVIVLYYV